MFAVLGLIAGVVIGLLVEPTLPTVLQPYLPIAIVAALDAILGATRAWLDGHTPQPHLSPIISMPGTRCSAT